MSRPQEPNRPFFPFGNPFRMISPKGSYLSSKLLATLNEFEETLACRIRKLKPAAKEDVASLSWMKSAMESLCAIHTDIKTLITALELPVCDWEDKWIDVYLDNSVKLLDICTAFSSEISRMKQGHLFLQCVMHNLGSSKQFSRACSSLDGWRHQMASENPRLDKCFSVMDSLAEMLDLPKIKNSSKGKVLMRAMYGVKVVTLFVCSVFAATFSGSSKKLMDIRVSDTFSWAEAFIELQTFVNTEIRNTDSVVILKELGAVNAAVEKLYPTVRESECPIGAEVLLDLTLCLGKSSEELSQGLVFLAKEVDTFFHILLTGRDALLGNLRIGGDNALDKQMHANKKVEGTR